MRIFMVKTIGRLFVTLLGLLFLLSPAHPVRLFERRTKSEFVAGHKILKIFQRENSEFFCYYPHAIFEDKTGKFWISCQANITVYDETKSLWTNFEGNASFYQETGW